MTTSMYKPKELIVQNYNWTC